MRSSAANVGEPTLGNAAGAGSGNDDGDGGRRTVAGGERGNEGAAVVAQQEPPPNGNGVHPELADASSYFGREGAGINPRSGSVVKHWGTNFLVHFS